MGFEVDGGIFRKLELTCFNGFFLSASKSLTIWEDRELLLDDEGTCVNGGKPLAWALFGKKDRNNENAKRRVNMTLQ